MSHLLYTLESHQASLNLHCFLIKQHIVNLKMIFVKNHEHRIMYLQFISDPLPTDSAGICLFHQRWTERFQIPLLVHCPYKVVQYFCKMWWWFFELAIWWLLHKTVRFLCSENGKCLFGAIKRKTSSCNIVCHPMMHMYAQYGHIITNYALILAITLVI